MELSSEKLEELDKIFTRQTLLQNAGIYILENELTIRDWVEISSSKNLSDDFIMEFQDQLQWFVVSQNQNLSEEFIRKYKDKVAWDYISYHQKLSENFIREFQDRVEWYSITKVQHLSDNFIIEFREKINFELYFIYQEASFLIMKKFILKTSHRNTKEFKTSHLTDIQRKEIEKILSLKYTFKN